MIRRNGQARTKERHAPAARPSVSTAVHATIGERDHAMPMDPSWLPLERIAGAAAGRDPPGHADRERGPRRRELLRDQPDEVADIVQEVFLSAFKNLNTLREKSAVGEDTSSARLALGVRMWF